MTAQTYHLIPNPWVLCEHCGDQVLARVDDRVNKPCGHAAPARSVCPSWDHAYGCQCDTADEAEAFEHMVEAAQRKQAAAAGLGVPVVEFPEVDKLFEKAATPPRPLKALAWLALLFLVAVLFLLLYHLGIMA